MKCAIRIYDGLDAEFRSGLLKIRKYSHIMYHPILHTYITFNLRECTLSYTRSLKSMRWCSKPFVCQVGMWGTLPPHQYLVASDPGKGKANYSLLYSILDVPDIRHLFPGRGRGYILT